jgi:hypothetical protein
LSAPASARTWISRRRAALASEDGFVIVIVMMLIVIGLLAGAAALSETLANRSHANRSQRSARALQAADAGIQTELYRANQLNLGGLKLSNGLSLSTIVTQLLTCPIPQINASGQVTGIKFAASASLGSPCPNNSASGISTPGPDEEAVGHHTYFQTQFVPGLVNIGDFIQLNPKIVVTGVDDNRSASDPTQYVSRRVEAILAPVAPWRTLEAGHNLTFDVPPALSALGIKLAGTTAFNGTAAAGNNLTIDGQAALLNTMTATGVSLSGGLTEPSALDYCGTYTHPNMTVTLTLGSITQPTSNCGSLVNRPAIQISTTKANCAPTTGTVACSTLFSSTIYPNTSSVPDSIYCTSSCGTLTFQPGDYVFCDFQYNGNVTLNASSLQAVRIFIDSPSSSRCSGHGSHASSGVTGFQTTYGNFVATKGVGNVLGLTHPSQAQVYVTGNGTNNGTVAYSTGSTLLSSQDMFLYAPTSNVTVFGGQTCILGTCVNTGTLAGAFIGYDLNVSGTAVVEDLGLLNYPLSSTLGPFYVKQYVECKPQYPLPSPDPTSGC